MSKRSSSQRPLLKSLSLYLSQKSSLKASTRLLAVLSAIIFLVSSGTGQRVFAGPIEDCRQHAQYGVPSKDPVLLCRDPYLLSHSSEHKVPIWVAYHLTRKYVTGKAKRGDQFKADAELPEGKRAELRDYEGSGYDRGHMMPAADAKWKASAMKQTFLLSNMAPQIGIGFNRGIWEELESKIRKWVKARGELYVYVGPIFLTNKIRTIGSNKVSVPTHFYKVVYDPAAEEAIGFLMPNAKLKRGAIPHYIVSIRKIEELTGLNFLSALKKDIQDSLETTQPAMWQ